MEWLKLFLESQPLFALFFTISLGYLLGEVNFKGLSLGAGAVLFVGLAVGILAPKAAPPGMLGALGLLLFLYGVGLSYGKEFFRGLTSPQGVKANTAALCGVLGAFFVTWLAIRYMGIDPGYAIGMFAGSGTSTATLQAAMQSMQSDAPAVGYSVAYPFGVAGPILFLFVVQALLKPVFPKKEGGKLLTREVRLTRRDLIDREVSALREELDPSVALTVLRQGSQNIIPHPHIFLRKGDILLLAGLDPVTLNAAASSLGEVVSGEISSDRADFEYYRIFVSKKGATEKTLGALQPPFEFEHRIIHVRRGDGEILASDSLTLELGDRVGILAPPGIKGELDSFFGDSIKGTADLNYITIGLGVCIGLLMGLVPLPLPGLGKVSLGMAGVLLFSLFLGKERSFAGRNWMIPLSANLILRNFGLTIFLAQVGMASGNNFIRTAVSPVGLSFFLTGVVILLVLVTVTFVVAHYIFRLPFDEAAGIVTGATGNPAILSFADRQIGTDNPGIFYAMIFPSMTIAKIILVELSAIVF